MEEISYKENGIGWVWLGAIDALEKDNKSLSVNIQQYIQRLSSPEVWKRKNRGLGSEFNDKSSRDSKLRQRFSTSVEPWLERNRTPRHGRMKTELMHLKNLKSLDCPESSGSAEVAYHSPLQTWVLPLCLKTVQRTLPCKIKYDTPIGHQIKKNHSIKI